MRRLSFSSTDSEPLLSPNFMLPIKRSSQNDENSSTYREFIRRLSFSSTDSEPLSLSPNFMLPVKRSARKFKNSLTCRKFIKDIVFICASIVYLGFSALFVFYLSDQHEKLELKIKRISKQLDDNKSQKLRIVVKDNYQKSIYMHFGITMEDG